MPLVDEFRHKFHEITSGYMEKDIFNMDETALYYKVVNCRTLANRKWKTSGHKASKERITVLIGCSMLGEKLPLLVIGMFYTISDNSIFQAKVRHHGVSKVFKTCC
jgi:hypothetical protein